MKLTNTIRDAFVRAAMKDVPSIDYAEKIRAAVTADAVEQLPPKVRAIYKDPDHRHFVATTWWGSRYSGSSVCVPGCDRSEFKLTDKAGAAVGEFQQLHRAQDEHHKALHDRLKAVAYSVTTRKALAEALPEFEKYLPADEAATLRTVPVIANVVSDFVAAGWPKGAKASKRAAAAVAA